jgi:amidase
MDELARAGLGEIATAIRGRQVSCREVMQACLDRIAAANPLHNAIVALQPAEQLLAQADAHDRLLAEGRWLGVLHGIPQAIKDLAYTRGLVTSHGSRILRANVPAADSLFVERMRAAGALIIGKTNTPEFGLGSQTYNDVYGITRNAHDPALTAGGSSGGAAVAVALGMLPAADGSDMMGSLRNPAAFNRIVGLRPSRGRVPAWPAIDQFIAQLGTAGPMARSVRDCALLLSVQAGFDVRDPLSLDGSGSPFAAWAAATRGDADDARGKRIGWFGSLDGHLAMQPGVLDSCQRALRRLEDLGCRIEPVAPQALGVPLQALWECWLVLRTVAAAPPLFGHLRKARELMKPEAIWEAERGLAMSAREVAEASQVRTTFYQSWLQLFKRYDYLAMPSAQVFPFDAALRWPAEVGGRSMDTYHRWMEVVIYATLTGSPAISMPVPLADPESMPALGDLMGIQLVGAPRDDLGVLALAAAYEAAVGTSPVPF